MIAGVDWTTVNIAGAFVVGAVLATIATIRIFRVVFGVRRDEGRKDRDAGAVRLDVLYVLEVVLIVLTIVYIVGKLNDR